MQVAGGETVNRARSDSLRLVGVSKGLGPRGVSARVNSLRLIGQLHQLEADSLKADWRVPRVIGEGSGPERSPRPSDLWIGRFVCGNFMFLARTLAGLLRLNLVLGYEPNSRTLAGLIEGCSSGCL